MDTKKLRHNLLETLASGRVFWLSLFAALALASASVDAAETYVVDYAAATNFNGALFRVDATSGNRTLVSDFGNTAQGALGLDPGSFALEASGTVLVSDRNGAGGGGDGPGALYRVDAASGVRSLVSDFGNAFQGPPARDIVSLALEAGSTVLVIDQGDATGVRGLLFRVDGLSGQRAVVSDFRNAGQGVLGVQPSGVAVRVPTGLPAATLTVIKEVINDDGRTAQPDDFGLTVNNNPVLSGARNTFPVSTPLVINETPLLGYDFVRITGAGCPQALGGSLVLNQGDNLTCTVTNDDSAIIGPPPAPDSVTEPLDLSNPRPSGCTFSEGEITCEETAGTPSSIVFDTNIPGDARFLQFEFSFDGADGQALASESLDAPGTSADDPRQRINSGDLGAVFISNVPIAALPGSSALPGGGFRSSGQFRLPTSGPTTAAVANFPSGAPGSVFRVRNLRIDRCTQRCFGRRPTICGTNGRDVLRGTRRNDVINGRGGNDRIEGRGGNDRICGGTGNDRLSGGKGNDQLKGEEGKDVLMGGAGRDRLDGGLGRDTCDDGSGEDRARRCDKKRRIP